MFVTRYDGRKLFPHVFIRKLFAGFVQFEQEPFNPIQQVLYDYVFPFIIALFFGKLSGIPILRSYRVWRGNPYFVSVAYLYHDGKCTVFLASSCINYYLCFHKYCDKVKI